MSDTYREIDSCVTAPEGFRAGITACGIKSDGSIPDLAILASDVPCIASPTALLAILACTTLIV
ncbi:MAG: hypothetical protein E6J21_13330 [Chloroflexota bacterium]|nr:MAG: hypothetical protein E6J21_13330 [Chloroflexota bacterium]